MNMALSNAECVPGSPGPPDTESKGVPHRTVEGAGRALGPGLLQQEGRRGRGGARGGEGKEWGRMRTITLGKIQKKKKRGGRGGGDAEKRPS